MAQQGIQFFRSAYQNVALINVLGFRRGVADTQPNRVAKSRSDFSQFLVFLHGQSFQRYDVDGL